MTEPGPRHSLADLDSHRTGDRRPSIDELKSHLQSLGADHVLTYDEFLSRENNTRTKIKEWIGRDGEMRLALNCVGGKETAEMAKLLSMDGKLGAWSSGRRSRDLPPRCHLRNTSTEVIHHHRHSDLRWHGQDCVGAASLALHLPQVDFVRLGRLGSEADCHSFCFLFEQSRHSRFLTVCRPATPDSTGFWLSNWVQTHPEERQTMMRSLAELTAQGKLKEPETEVVELAGTDEEVAAKMSGVMKRIEEGRGKKILLHWKDE